MGCHPSHWRTRMIQDCFLSTNQYNYGKSQFFMGNFTINGDFPLGYGYSIPTISPWSMDWFCWENLNRKPYIFPWKYCKIPVNFPLNHLKPIHWPMISPLSPAYPQASWLTSWTSPDPRPRNCSSAWHSSPRPPPFEGTAGTAKAPRRQGHGCHGRKWSTKTGKILEKSWKSIETPWKFMEQTWKSIGTMMMENWSEHLGWQWKIMERPAISFVNFEQQWESHQTRWCCITKRDSSNIQFPHMTYATNPKRNNIIIFVGGCLVIGSRWNQAA